MRRIGVLTPLPADHPDAKARHAAFLESLRQLGWSEGHNVRIEARWSAGDLTIARKNAGDWSRSHLTLSWQLALWAEAAIIEDEVLPGYETIRFHSVESATFQGLLR